MKVTIDGITYEGTEEEIRRIVEDPPHRPPVQVSWHDGSYPRHWDGSPVVTCSAAERAGDALKMYGPLPALPWW